MCGITKKDEEAEVDVLRLEYVRGSVARKIREK